jgi:hypothetical protein
MSAALLNTLERQNRLLKACLAVTALTLAVLLSTAAVARPGSQRLTELDVERINIIGPDGKREMVLANRLRLPKAVLAGREVPEARHKPGILFYNQAGDECGGLLFDGRQDGQGKPNAGVHFSMDRFGGDQQLALGSYEENGFMETGLNVFDRGLAAAYAPLYQTYLQTPAGPAKEALKQRWQEAGGEEIQRLFVGRTRGQSSAVILADAKGRPRIMMLVTPEGQAMLNFLDENGQILQSLPRHD